MQSNETLYENKARDDQKNIYVVTRNIWRPAMNKEIKNAQSALLSYISARDFLRTREKC